MNEQSKKEVLMKKVWMWTEGLTSAVIMIALVLLVAVASLNLVLDATQPRQVITVVFAPAVVDSCPVSLLGAELQCTFKCDRLLHDGIRTDIFK